jgi:hypothetical protein
MTLTAYQEVAPAAFHASLQTRQVYQWLFTGPEHAPPLSSHKVSNSKGISLVGRRVNTRASGLAQTVLEVPLSKEPQGPLGGCKTHEVPSTSFQYL